jgi:hypothetical protein
MNLVEKTNVINFNDKKNNSGDGRDSSGYDSDGNDENDAELGFDVSGTGLNDQITMEKQAGSVCFVFFVVVVCFI